MHTPKTATARPEILYISLATRPIMSNRDALLCEIKQGMSRNNDTQRLKKNTRHTWALNGRRPWRYSLCISRCRFRTPYDRPRPHKGAKPVSLFVSYGPRGPSGGPAPDAPLPLLPPLPLPPERLLEPPPPPPLPAAPVFSFLVAFLAGASPAAATLVSVPPSADPPPVALRRLVPLPAARAYVREHAGGTKPTLAVLCPLPALVLLSASRYSGSDGGVVDIGVYQATAGYMRAEAGPKRPRDGRESAHRRGVRPAMAAHIRYLAQVQGEPLDVLRYEVRQPGPVPAEVSDGESSITCSWSILAPSSNAPRRLSTRSRAT